MSIVDALIVHDNLINAKSLGLFLFCIEAGAFVASPVLLRSTIPARLDTHETLLMTNFLISNASTYAIVESTGIYVETVVTESGMLNVSICPLIALARLSKHVLFCQKLLKREAISRILNDSLSNPMCTILNPAAVGLGGWNAPFSMAIRTLLLGLDITWLSRLGYWVPCNR